MNVAVLVLQNWRHLFQAAFSITGRAKSVKIRAFNFCLEGKHHD